MRTVAFQWSGGKDSVLGLGRLLGREDVRVDRLLTTTDTGDAESTVHEIPVELLAVQARCLGLPLQTIPMPGEDLDGYAGAMRAAAATMRGEGVDAMAFGDLDCSGARAHREELFGPLGMDVLEPLEGMSSRECVDAFLDSGHRAVTVVVDASVLGPSHVGVPLDRAFVDRLPEGADPCGELGEYHSFVHDGPLFSSPVSFTLSPVRSVQRSIGTTRGIADFSYWVSTPQPRSGASDGIG